MEIDYAPTSSSASQPGFATPDAPPPTSTEAGLLSAIPAQLADRVTVGPAPSWVVDRQLNELAGEKEGSNPILLWDQQFQAERDEMYFRVVRRVDTVRALRENGRWQTYFRPQTDRLTVHSLAVCRGSQREENARSERLRIIQREAELEGDVVTGEMTALVLLENLRVGDILDLSFTRHTRSRIFPEHHSGLCRIPDYCTIREYFLSVRFASPRVMRWKTHEPPWPPTLSEGNDEIEWLWKRENIRRVEPEYGTPTWHAGRSWVQFSDFQSWQEISAGLHATWPDSSQDSEFRSRAEVISAGREVLVDRVTQALNYVQDEIRYLSLTGEMGGQVPASPRTILERGFGDCKDKALLGAHLLRLLGVPARPVLVSVAFGAAVEKFLPSPDVFDHAIVEYELDGQLKHIDLTAARQGGNALTRPGTLLPLGLPVENGVETLQPITRDFSADRMELRETFYIDTSGRSSTVRVQLTLTGRDAETARNQIAFDGLEDFAEYRERLYQRRYRGAKRVGSCTWKDDRANNRLVVNEFFDLPQLVWEARDGVFGLFEIKAYLIQSHLDYYRDGLRKTPWRLPFPSRIRHIIELESPHILPAESFNLHKDTAFFRYSAVERRQQGRITYTYDLEILRATVPAVEFDSHIRRVIEVWPKTNINGRFTLGTVVSWAKRSPEESLADLGRPADVARPRRKEFFPNKSENEAKPPGRPGPATAPETSGAGKNAALSPRKENKDYDEDAFHYYGERRQIQRPNMKFAESNHLTEPSTRRSSGRRREKAAQTSRQTFLLVLATVLGSAGLIALFIVLLRAR